MLGARWDIAKKVWFVPQGVDPALFVRWLPQNPTINIRSSTYFIAESSRHCWKCGQLTRVYGFVLAPGHEVFEIDDADESKDAWTAHDLTAVPFYVTLLIPSVLDLMKSAAPHYRVDFSQTTRSFYWMNHCERCGMKQGDHPMYCEPGGAFFPTDEAAARQITLRPVSAPFGCNGDAGYGNPLFEYMTQQAQGRNAQPPKSADLHTFLLWITR